MFLALSDLKLAYELSLEAQFARGRTWERTWERGPACEMVWQTILRGFFEAGLLSPLHSCSRLIGVRFVTRSASRGCCLLRMRSLCWKRRGARACAPVVLPAVDTSAPVPERVVWNLHSGGKLPPTLKESICLCLRSVWAFSRRLLPPHSSFMLYSTCELSIWACGFILPRRDSVTRGPQRRRFAHIWNDDRCCRDQGLVHRVCTVCSRTTLPSAYSSTHYQLQTRYREALASISTFRVQNQRLCAVDMHLCRET